MDYELPEIMMSNKNGLQPPHLILISAFDSDLSDCLPDDRFSLKVLIPKGNGLSAAAPHLHIAAVARQLTEGDFL